MPPSENGGFQPRDDVGRGGEVHPTRLGYPNGVGGFRRLASQGNQEAQKVASDLFDLATLTERLFDLFARIRRDSKSFVDAMNSEDVVLLNVTWLDSNLGCVNHGA